LSNDETIRGDPRFPVSLRVRVRLESWEQFEELYIRNISRGGMFVGMSDPAPPGTQLRVEVTAPNGRHLALRGQVAHTVAPETAEAEGKRPGVGVRFLELTAEERDMLDLLLHQARGVAAEGSAKLPALPTSEDGESALVDALRSQLGELKQQSYFEVLGVPYDAAEDDVRRGYLMQVQRWHPERFASESATVRELAAEIFIIIKRAYDDLSDPARLALLSQRTRPPRKRTAPPPPEAPVRRAGSSELDFALTLAKDGRFDDARKVLALALAHDPDNWALREQYNLVSARAALADADAEAAMLHYQEVLRVNPANEDAVREVRRLMRLRREARRKVLARLFTGKKI